MNREVTMELLEKYGKEFVQDRANRVAQNAVVGKGVNAAATDSSVEREIANTFSISLEQGKITNQKKSGRCWMFAALNCMRFQVMKHCNLETFELSQNYTLFYDKLEKSNYFLNTILDTLEEDTDSRLIAHLLSAPLNDGGQWDMLCAIVDKYGLVPKEAMPESEISSNTNEMVSYMTEKLREFACTLREAYRAGSTKEELLAKKEEMMQVVYNMLCICLGNPPKTFDFEYRDKDKQFHRECEELKKAAIAQMKDGEPVWFGCDVGKRSTRESGVMDTKIFALEDLFQTDFPMTKAQRLDYGQSLMTHAMVFQGVNIDENGQPNRWRVENSWGPDAGRDGYYTMTDRWFDEYTYQIVVNRKYLPKEVLEAYEQEPIVLRPWDPMGSLA